MTPAIRQNPRPVDRLAVTYIARPMRGHRQMIDIPVNFRRASLKERNL